MLPFALFGAVKAFESPLHVGRPNLGDRDLLFDRIGDILDRRWLSNGGRYVQDFEKRVAEIAGTRHAIACCNATIALEIAIRALGLRGEVIIPSYTFVATAHSLQWQEITPVFADIRSSDHLLDPEQIERHITPRTTGILPVHLWGHSCDVDAIEEIAKRRGLEVLYDASHAFGCDGVRGPIGGEGRASIFSFHATKFINAGEGGAIVTNDDDLAAKMRLMKNFGFRGYDDVTHVGTNGKMSELSAALGLTNLEAIDSVVETNRRNHQAYEREVAGIPGVRILPGPPAGRFNYQYVIAEIDEHCPISRDSLVRVLWAENFLARKYFWPGCHRMEPYRSLYPNSYLTLPTTEKVAARVIVVPTGEAVDDGIICRACGIIRAAIEHGAEIEAAIVARDMSPPSAVGRAN